LKFRSFQELLILLKKHMSFIDAVFNSNHRQMHIVGASGMIGEDDLNMLEEMEIVDYYKSYVLLNESIVQFGERYLIDDYDEELLDYGIIFNKIDIAVNNYHKSIEMGDSEQKHLSSIHRQLRRIPRNLRDSLKAVQRHVEFTYLSASSREEKLRELQGYEQMLSNFHEKIDVVEHGMERHESFFRLCGDDALLLQQSRVLEYVVDARSTLIRTSDQVRTYISETVRSIERYRHIVKLKEMKDRKELLDNTNFSDFGLSEGKRPILNSFTDGMKRYRDMKIHPEFQYDYPDEFEALLQRYSQNLPNIESKISIAGPIDEELIRSNVINIIDYEDILEDYIAQDRIEFDFLTYLMNREPQLCNNELVDAYAGAISSGMDLVENCGKYVTIGDFDCLIVYPKGKVPKGEINYVD